MPEDIKNVGDLIEFLKNLNPNADVWVDEDSELVRVQTAYTDEDGDAVLTLI